MVLTDDVSPPRDRAAARRAQLERCQRQVEAVILSRQDPRTGLLPASTAVTVHGDYTHAWVRDNVYSILGPWALALAWQRVEPARAAPLFEATRRLMRGLLAAMMRQASKLERFKHSGDPLDALHAKYATHSGEPVVGDEAWGHLQIDATAIFLLFVARMSEGPAPLALVEDEAEHGFVQNLVHYLSRAHGTPDYGVWERGHKGNQGVAEVNASSVGMAKAALEAIDGCVLRAGLPAIVVVEDDIAFARQTLKHLLPRESVSKETDAALLAVIGFPAFAVEDAALAARTRERIVQRLQGRYGCKRFLRDGHQTVLEDPDRLHYEPGELQRFEHLECEWPLFFTYLLIDAVWRGQATAADDYRQRLESLMVERDGQRLLPELYRVPARAVEAERARPRSQGREPNENVPLVWAQSLYLVGALLHDGCLPPEDLDPRAARPPTATPELLVLLLAGDELACVRLHSQGLPAVTEARLAPLQVHDATVLERAWEALGAVPSLGLGGRPRRRLGSLATGHLLEAGGQPAIFRPAAFDHADGPLGLDNRLRAEQLRAELAHLRRHWRAADSPLLVLDIGNAALDAPGAPDLLAALHELAATTGVRLAPFDGWQSQVSRRRLGALAAWPEDGPPAAAAPPLQAALRWDEAATRPLTAARAAALEHEPDTGVLQARLAASRNPYEQAELIDLLWRRCGPDHDPGIGSPLRTLTLAVHAEAARERRWGVLRRTAGLLGLHDATLEDAVAQIVVRQKRVAVGRAYSAASVISRPLSMPEIAARLQAHGGADARGRALLQEVLLLLGLLIKADSALLGDTLTLRPWTLVQLLSAWLAREHGISPAEAFDHLLELSPWAIHGRLREVIAHEREMSGNLRRQQTLHHRDRERGARLVRVSFPPEGDPPAPAAPGGWWAWREAAGGLLRLPEDFHRRVWSLLRVAPALVIGDQLDVRNRLDSRLARADTTPGERSFALQIDDLLHKIPAPEYRQLSIEALLALCAISRANPALRVGEPLVLDVLLGLAVRQAWEREHPLLAGQDYDEHRAGAWQAFYTLPPHAVAGQLMAVFESLLEGAATP